MHSPRFLFYYTTEKGEIFIAQKAAFSNLKDFLQTELYLLQA